LGKNWNPVLDAILGGWQLNSFLTFQSGMPMSISVAGGIIENGVQRPNIVGNIRSGASIKEVVDSRGQISYFSNAGFSKPAEQIPGDAPRYVGDARGSGVRNLDLSIFKNVQVTERFKVQLRGEFFNFTNTPRFGNPNTSYGSSRFGSNITSQINGARTVQVGVRAVF